MDNIEIKKYNKQNHPIIPFFNDLDNMFNSFFTEITNASTKGQNSNYPLTNIYTEIVDGKNKGVIEIAAAGFKKDELKIRIEENILIVTGTKEKPIEDSEKTNRKYTMNNIAKRNFERKVIVFENLEKIESKFEDGILTIEMYEKKIEPVITTVEIN